MGARIAGQQTSDTASRCRTIADALQLVGVSVSAARAGGVQTTNSAISWRSWGAGASMARKAARRSRRRIQGRRICGVQGIQDRRYGNAEDRGTKGPSDSSWKFCCVFMAFPPMSCQGESSALRPLPIDGAGRHSRAFTS